MPKTTLQARFCTIYVDKYFSNRHIQLCLLFLGTYRMARYLTITRHSIKKRQSAMAHGQNSTVASCPRLSIFASSWTLRSNSGLFEIPVLHQQMSRMLLCGTGGGIQKRYLLRQCFSVPSTNIALEMVGNDTLLVN